MKVDDGYKKYISVYILYFLKADLKNTLEINLVMKEISVLYPSSSTD